jgi:hypothetical protein
LNWFPSKKNTIIFLVILAVGAGSFWWLNSLDKSNNGVLSGALNDQSSGSKTSEGILLALLEKQKEDTDEDGLDNWQEALWETDSNNPDTDNDSFLDGDEIKDGYDPTDLNSNPQTGIKAKPILNADDEEEQNVAEDYNAPISIEDINLTREAARGMNSQFIEQQEAGNEELDISDPLSMLEKNNSGAITNFLATFDIKIDENELKIIDDNSYERIVKYANDVDIAIPANPYPNLSDYEIFTEAMQTNNFEKIDGHLAHYDSAISNMKKIVVPTDFLQIHKREIELFLITQEIYKNIKKIDTDPLKAILALQKNEEINKEMDNLVVGFLNAVADHK